MFEVMVNDQLVYSKVATGDFPDPDQVVREIRKLKTASESHAQGCGKGNSSSSQRTDLDAVPSVTRRKPLRPSTVPEA